MDFLRKLANTRGFIWLGAIVLAFIISFSVLLVAQRDLNSFTDDQELRDLVVESGCIIENYELSCDVEYIDLGEIIIDTSDNPIVPSDGMNVLTKEGLVAEGFSMTYEEFILNIGHSSTTFTYDDAVELVETFVEAMRSVVLILGTIFVSVGLLLGNIFFTLFNQLLLSRRIRQLVRYGKAYRLTFLGWGLIIVVNELSRLIFGVSATNVIRSNIPWGWLVVLIIELGLIFLFSSLIIEKDPEIEQTEDVLEL